MMQKIVNQPAHLIRFHKPFCLAGSREEQLFLTEKLRRVFSRAELIVKTA
jgi:hypothetical protein